MLVRIHSGPGASRVSETCSRSHNGFTLIELLVTSGVIALFIGLILAGVQRSRMSAARVRCADQIRQLGLALQGYHDSHGHLPAGMSLDKGKSTEPYLSWLARILPHIEQGALWRQTEESYRLDKNFLSPTHVARSTVVTMFICPADSRLATAASKDITGHPVAYTSYLGVVGRNAGVIDGLLYMDSRHKLTDATDGGSNTLLLGERPPSAALDLGWWYAGWGQAQNGDAEFLLGTRTRCYNKYRATCDEGPYHFTTGKFDNPCDTFHFWSPHTGGANFAFADGSVRFLSYSADPIMPALATRAGGEAVAVPE
jgi:prepilin-type processing-associated H-X9-DG protein/prepilin-type N-terminal cleavage/methylation domain-containing protein